MVVDGDLHFPVAVRLDHAERKLYWIDQIDEDSYKIERSDLDGGEREVLLRVPHWEPAHLAIGGDTIYWTDWHHNTVWSVPKNSTTGHPTEFASYYGENYELGGVVARDNVVNCSAIPATKPRTDVSQSVPRPANRTSSAADALNSLTNGAEKSKGRTNVSKIGAHVSKMIRRFVAANCKIRAKFFPANQSRPRAQHVLCLN